MEQIINNFNVINKSTEILNYTECFWMICIAEVLWGVSLTLILFGAVKLCFFVNYKLTKVSTEDEKHFYVYFIVAVVLITIGVLFSSCYFSIKEQNNASTCKCVYTIHITDNEKETLNTLNVEFSDVSKVYSSYYRVTLYTDVNATEIEIFDIKLDE